MSIMKAVFTSLTVVILSMAIVDRAHGQPRETLPPKQGIIFIVNGSGDDTAITDNLGSILGARGLPFVTHTVRWCQWARPAKDHLDYATQVQAGHALAAKITWYRGAYPNEKIYVIGQSAGTHVVLTAARCLPADSVDRIVLMGASVSQYHDITPALRCSRGGLDNLCSSRDQVLDIAVDLVGNADRLPGRAAGLFGFKLAHPHDELYKKLRQYYWDESWSCWGHHGRHVDYTSAAFLDGAIVPLMIGHFSVRN
jgi:pimeloyl-ACP methyl ester carboxylesterase